MKHLIHFLIISLVAFNTSAKPKKGVKIDVTLNPAGSFTINARIKGSIQKKGDMYVGDKLVTKVSSFKTGVDLRDDHTKKKMNFKKFPQIIVTDIRAKQNKGIAKIKIFNKIKKIQFKYKDLNEKYAQAFFNISLKEFGIGGINYMGVGVEDIVKVSATVKKK